MIKSHLGELAAVAATIFWTVTALSFEVATKRIGTLSVNIMRLVLGFLFMSLFTTFYRGMSLPTDATAESWHWLLVSGLVGFVFGDFCLLKSFGILGSRISMLIMALVPPITAFVSFIFLNEAMNLKGLFGMFLTLFGIALVILKRQTSEELEDSNGRRKLKLNYPIAGILFALGGAFGQAVGLVLSKHGMGSYDAFAASQIRILAGVGGFAIVIIVMNRTKQVLQSMRDTVAMKALVLGSVFGPFLGVGFSLLAIQHTQAGIASTIMAMTPVLIIIPSVFIFKEKVNRKEVIGAILSVIGVALFFL